MYMMLRFQGLDPPNEFIDSAVVWLPVLSGQFILGNP